MNRLLTEVIAHKQIQRFAAPPTHRLAIGLISNGERLEWADSNIHANTSSSPFYEIGSITKTMTGLLLAVGEQKGFWSRSDSLSDLIPEWSSSPYAKQTTLQQLVTHTANLPRVPLNFKATIADKKNPYANYTEEHLAEAVLSEVPKTNRGHAYSNYGFGLLGWILSKRLGMSLHDAFQTMIFNPLGMTNTMLRSNNTHSPDMIPVFNAKGNPVPHWDFQDATAGAGAVCSTLPDMLTYIEANLSRADQPLGDALAVCHQEHYSIFQSRGIGVGYSWMFYKEKDGSTTHWHNGGTYGSSSFATFNRDKGKGLVILSNYGTDIRSQIPLVGMGKLNVDKLARTLTSKLYQKD
ncbi:serine hydrolase [Paenibacillus sp. LHD-117]|uniref:serine hydrolase domain-containing protein n=1 Tax=Paenibacillus sp. LHD-117 TaxID=3071412 RepID=UPI0027DEBCDA|nr:serine hydrolase [Paenibacillus sp. LHD-117]MDQ6420560.1 serine hydrolase [Paenibacillus sp. LHD-117]